MNIQTIKNVSDCVPLYLPHSLYLKPVAKFNISVSLPSAITGKTISNWEVMEKFRQIIQPDVFSVLKVSKSTLEYIRFEAEIEDKSKLKSVVSRLDGKIIKLSGYSDNIKVRASEMKDDFPTRHDWDSYFRDARNMDEMKPGERPDTIHFVNLPIGWFCPRHLENTENAKPSESIFKRIFEKFGKVRCVDIPICDPYRSQMKSHMSGIKTFSFDNEQFFEGYVQFNEYLGFVKTMDEFRGMKLVRKDGDKNLAVNIVVDFDKTKHLNDSNIKRRKIVRDRLIAKEKEKEEIEKKKIQEAEERKEKEKKQEEAKKQAELERQQAREERRKEKHLKKLREKEHSEISSKIRAEEKKLLEAQRKLESIRLIDALFERIKTKFLKESAIKQENSSNKKIIKFNKDETSVVKDSKNLSQIDLRNKLVKKYKNSQEEELKKRQEKLQNVKTGKVILSKLLVSPKEEKSRSPSINTISSNDSIFSKSDSETTSKNKKLKKKKKRSSSSSSSESETIISKTKPKQLVVPPGFPTVFNPETGEWMGMGVGLGMYPYSGGFFPGTMPTIRPGFYPNHMNFGMYRGGGGQRYMRGWGRGQYRMRGSGGYQSGNPYDNDQYQRYFNKNSAYDDNYKNDDSHHRRSGSGSRSRSKKRRSRSRSRNRSRNRSKSRSRSRSRRSRSRSRSRSRRRTKNRSKSRSHSRSKSNDKSKKLASTLRNTRSKSSSDWSRSRSRSRSKRTWSRETSYSRSRSRSSSQKSGSQHAQPEKTVPTAKEIQRGVQQKLHERVLIEEEKKKGEMNAASSSKKKSVERESLPLSDSKKRSNSVDSSKFVSPKRRDKSATPEKDWSHL